MRCVHVILLVCFLIPGTESCSAARSMKGIHLDTIRMPPGFSISLYTGEAPGARSMTLGPKGIVFVGTRGEGKVHAVVDEDKNGVADRVFTIASGLNSPNGVAFRDGALYVAEISRVLRYDDIANHLASPPEPVVVNDSFPTDKHHGWKYMAFGPDGKLYVPVGAPCNVCESKDPRFASIMRMNPDGSGLEIFARGIRNTVGFDWDPRTGVLWFTNNGRDWMGDDLPPDTLHRAPEKGLHFGFPFCHGGVVVDPDHGREGVCAKYAPAAIELGAHVAALGMKFYMGTMFPPDYRDRVFIAEHGSWNRTVSVGYRLVSVKVKDGRASDHQVFAQGWLQGDKAWGRPVDVLVLPDGSMLVSDDRAGAIYRIVYKKP